MFRESITFKQAFVIVIGLHVFCYLGITKWSEYKKEVLQTKAKLHTNKSQPVAIRDTKNDWPSIAQYNKELQNKVQVKTQPIIEEIETTLTDATTQLVKQTELIKTAITPKTKRILTSSSSVPKDNTSVAQMTTKKKVDTAKTVPEKKSKQTPKLVEKEVIESRIISSNPIPSSNSVERETYKIYREPQNKIRQARPPVTVFVDEYVPATPHSVIQQSYIIDEVEYIETQYIVSTHTTL